MNLQKMGAFIKRDFYIQTSYRFAFLLRLCAILFSVLTFYFIAKLFGKAAVPYLKSYGGDYFSFVLVGLAFSGYLRASLSSFAQTLRNEQMMGTLENMILSPTKLSTLICCSSLWNFIFASVEVIVYLALGGLLFGVDFSKGNFLAAFVILFLTILCFSGIGIISASFIMVFKRGNPINWVLSSGSALFGGVFFPITILPLWLRSISWMLPITYALRAMRHAMLQGYPLSAMYQDLLILLVFTALILPLSIFCFRYAVKQAKVKGTLAFY